ncbi:MAG: membrane or secreted protein [Bacteroidota bacterium]
MKTILAFLLSITFIASKAADKSPVSGAWQGKDASGNTISMICSENYLMYAVYDLAQKKYVRSGGGTYQLSEVGAKKIFSFKRDFNTEDSTVVGLTVANLFTLNNNELSVSEGPLAGNWTKVDDVKSSKVMANVWKIRAREGSDFKMQTILKGSRKTLKILSGNRFQWAAFDTDTHQFFGTGGGTYTVKNGKYTETIEFFSRDNKRVGASLTFDCVLNGKDWTHAGQSSTGARVHEIWEKVE